MRQDPIHLSPLPRPWRSRQAARWWSFAFVFWINMCLLGVIASHAKVMFFQTYNLIDILTHLPQALVSMLRSPNAYVLVYGGLALVSGCVFFNALRSSTRLQPRHDRLLFGAIICGVLNPLGLIPFMPLLGILQLIVGETGEGWEEAGLSRYAISAMFWMLLVLWAFARSDIERAKHNAIPCNQCGYPMTGLSRTSICPECGDDTKNQLH